MRKKEDKWPMNSAQKNQKGRIYLKHEKEN